MSSPQAGMPFAGIFLCLAIAPQGFRCVVSIRVFNTIRAKPTGIFRNGEVLPD
jgi:hypothetical protein